MLHRTIAYLALLTLTGCANTTSSNNEALRKPQTNNSAAYHRLVSDIKAQPREWVLYDQLLTVYTQLPQYSPYSAQAQGNKLRVYAQMDAGNWTACMITAEQMLSDNFSSLTAHYSAMVCAYEGKIKIRGDYHKVMLEGLMGAIKRTGNALSINSPIKLASANDLYTFAELQNYRVIGQALAYRDKKPLHKIKLQNNQSKKTVYWFIDLGDPASKL